MSIDSRSRSRSPICDEVEEDGGSPRNRRSDSRWKFDRSRNSGRGGGSSNNRVYVSNIPYEFKWQDLKDTFRTQVGDVSYVEMFEDDNRRPRGSALVEFNSFDLAQKAVDKMHHYEVKGRKLVVKEKSDAMHSRDFQFLFNPNSGGGSRDRNTHRSGRDMDRRINFDRPSFHDQSNDDPGLYGDTYGLSIPFLKEMGINGPLVNKIFVANLDYKVAEEELTEVFHVAGNVINCEVLKDQDGKSRGFAVIEYEHPVQAVQAISMLHNQTYYDRVINVRLDRVAEKQKKTAGNTSKLPPGLKSLGMGLGANGTAITDVSALSVQASTMSSNFGGGNMGNMSGAMVGGAGFDMANIGGVNSNNMRPNMNAMAMLGLSGGIDQLNAIGNSMGLNMGNLAPNPVQLGSNQLGIGVNLPMGNQMSGNIGNSPIAAMGLQQSMQNQSGNMLGGGGSNMAANFPSNVSNYGNQNRGNGNQNGSSSFSSSSSNERRGSSSFTSASSSRTIVQVTNLPLNYTWKSLKDLCRNYGDIKFAEIRSKGTGLVRFSSESEARRASEVLDRQRFDGRVLEALVL